MQYILFYFLLCCISISCFEISIWFLFEIFYFFQNFSSWIFKFGCFYHFFFHFFSFFSVIFFFILTDFPILSLPLTDTESNKTKFLVEIKEFSPIERTSHSTYLLSIWNPFISTLKEKNSFFNLYGNISIKIFMEEVTLQISVPLSEVIFIWFFFFHEFNLFLLIFIFFLVFSDLFLQFWLL